MPRAAPPLHLEIEQLAFAYPGQPALLAGWSAVLPAGVTWLQGETGSGKTTLLRLLAGQMAGQMDGQIGGQTALHAGRWRLVGAPTTGLPSAERAPADGLKAGPPLVASSDDPDLHHETLTAEAVAQRQRRLYPGFDGAAWQAHLQGFGLAPHLAKPMLALSTGSRHKLRLAATLSAQAPLTLLDEPTAGLDAPSMRHLHAALAAAHAAAQQVLIVAGSLGPDAPPAWPVISLPPA